MKSIRPYLFVLLLSMVCIRCGEQPIEKPNAPEPETYVRPEETAFIAGEPPENLKFVPVTRLAGLSDFMHENGYSGQKYLPETMGSGGGFFDYDNDGDLDLFLVNGRHFAPNLPPAAPSLQALYENDGHGNFKNVTEPAGLNVSLYGMGCAMADVDGDGDNDLLITAALDGNRLFRNNGDKTFTDITGHAGLAIPTWTDSDGRSHAFWSTSAAFFDYDNDGWLDLFVCNYVQWSIENDIFTTRVGIGKSFTTPELYRGQTCLLYRNLGSGRFENVTEAAGILNPEGKSLGVAVSDLNNDRYLDIAVANDSQPNFLYINRQNGTFEDIALSAGVAFDENGRARAGMGIDIADGYHDKPVIAIGNFSHEPISFYTPEQDLFFVDAAGRSRISRPSLLSLTFGLAFFDYDLDGYLDLAAANGHIEPEIERVEKEVKHAQSPQLFKSYEGKRFEDVTSSLGGDISNPIVGRGLAYGDIDGDGDIDVLITENGGPVHLFRNDNFTKNNYVRIHPAGLPPNTNAIGAKVTVRANGRPRTQMVRTGSSYLSQHELTLTFGLGDITRIDSITIQWPDGSIQDITNPHVLSQYINATTRIEQPSREMEYTE